MKNYFLIIHRYFKKVVLWVCFLFFSCNLFAQKEDYNWVLYKNSRVDFNHIPPVVTSDIPNLIGNNSNLTSISDKGGNLLFYINGSRVYNYSHQIIFSVQAALSNQVSVVPYPYDDKKFFWCVPKIFPDIKLVLFTIDMNANSGLGAVTETQSLSVNDLPLDFIITRKSNSPDYWFVRFYKDKTIVNTLTSSGLINPTTYSLVVSDTKGLTSKVTPDMSSIFLDERATIKILDINSSTGKVQNVRNIYTKTSGVYYCFEFSRNNEFVYIASQNISTYETTISQFSLQALNNETEFKNTEKILYYQTLDANHLLSDIQLAHNNNIYITFHDYFLWSIDSPDLPFPNCFINSQSLYLNGGIGGILPNYLNYYASFNYQQLCNVINFNYIGFLGKSYFWQFGDSQTSTELNPTHTYSTPGNYTVTLTVTYNDNSSDTLTKDIEIYNKPLKPTIEHK